MRDGSTVEAPAPEAEIPWTDYVDTVLRWKRFVALGVGLAWGALLVAAWLWPRFYGCEATLSMPATVTAGAEAPLQSGLSLATYKKLERSLGDEALLTDTFRGKLSQRQIWDIQRNLGRYVAPVASGGRDDMLRLDKAETIVAVTVSYSAWSAQQTEDVVEGFGAMIRDLVVAGAAEDRIQRELLQSTTMVSQLETRKLDLDFTNRSLHTLEADLQRLSSGSAQAWASAPREVVDIANGGYRYLPPPLQIVGVKARLADNDHDIRLTERRFKIETNKLAFLRRVDARLHELAGQGAGWTRTDLAALFDNELSEYLKQLEGAEAEDLRAELGMLPAMLRVHRSGILFIQQPTARPRSRAVALAAAAAGALLFFPFAALLGESWRRWHAKGSGAFAYETGAASGS